jgi:hypothetical protein
MGDENQDGGNGAASCAILPAKASHLVPYPIAIEHP